MKVSIITTSYNSGLTIKDTLLSVARQDYPDIEHIVIDGGSRDDTMHEVARFPHVAKAVSERDGGIFHAMNKGLAMCTGDVICFLNSDDWYNSDDVVSTVVRYLLLSDCMVAYGDLQYVKQYNPERIVRTWKSGQFRRQNLYLGWMPPHPAFFARREVYEEVGFFNTDFTSAADYELMLRILLKYEHDACHIPQILVKMRQGGYSNASIKNRLIANREDHEAWVRNGLKPWLITRYLKPIRKIPQYIFR